MPIDSPKTILMGNCRDGDDECARGDDVEATVCLTIGKVGLQEPMEFCGLFAILTTASVLRKHFL